jgi:EAL domain-containing protein (putative c-di-GMP-specific phosphodiesterase class I)
MPCSRCQDPAGLVLWVPDTDRPVLGTLGAAGVVTLLGPNQAWLPWTEVRNVWSYVAAHAPTPAAWRATAGSAPTAAAAEPARALAEWAAAAAAPGIKMWIQAIVDRAGQIVGWETLARGVDPTGAIRPFPWLLEEAERTQSRFWLDRRCREDALRQWGPRVRSNQFLSINFLPSVIYHPQDCLSTTLAALRAVGLRPDQCVLEVVESERVDERRLEAVMAYYRDVAPGVRFALDDVGTGYNTLARVAYQRPAILKLDRSVTAALPHDAQARHVGAAVVRMAAAWNAVPLAEGVETAEEFAAAADLGYQWFQGYYWHRPEFPAVAVLPAHLTPDARIG